MNMQISGRVFHNNYVCFVIFSVLTHCIGQLKQHKFFAGKGFYLKSFHSRPNLVNFQKLQTRENKQLHSKVLLNSFPCNEW